MERYETPLHAEKQLKSFNSSVSAADNPGMTTYVGIID